MKLILSILFILLTSEQPMVVNHPKVIQPIVKSQAIVNVPINSMLSLVNNERIKQNLPTLFEDNRLDRVAQDKANELCATGYFSHEDTQGKMSWHFFTEEGYRYVYAGENLAKGYLNENEAMVAFMNSPEHKDNILNGNYKNFGYAQCGIYMVQEFGSLY